MAAAKKKASASNGPGTAAGVTTTPAQAGAQAAADLVSRTPAELAVPPAPPPPVEGKVRLTDAMVKVQDPVAYGVHFVSGDVYAGTPQHMRALADAYTAKAPDLGFGVRQAALGAATRLRAAAQHATEKAARKAGRKPTAGPATTPKVATAAKAIPKAIGVLGLAQDVDKAWTAYQSAKAKLQKALA